MQLRHVSGFIALSALLAAGCGGSAGGSNAGAPVGDFAFGELSGRAAVSNPPISSSSEYIIGTAFTGTFSSLKIRELNPSISETRIVATSVQFGPGAAIYSFAIDGSDPQKITPNVANVFDLHPTASANGKVLFERTIGGVTSLNLINMDGSGLTQLVASGVFSCAMDAAGDRVAYNTGPASVTVVNLNNNAQTVIPMPGGTTGIGALALSPEGSILYTLTNDAGSYGLVSMLSNGTGGVIMSTPIPGTPNSMAISPDGSEIALTFTGAPAQVDRVGMASGAVVTFPLFSSQVAGISYSADGKQFVVSTGPDGQNDGLYLTPLDFSSFTRITSLTAVTAFPSWSPFIRDRTLISGGGGLLGTRACGVILGERSQGGTTSVVAFDVTTPSSVVMTAQSLSNLSNTSLVFSIDADNITKLAYANTTSWKGIRAIGPSTPVLSANGALVSLDGIDGSVISVLPFNGTRAAGSRPTVTDNGSIRTFSGSFLAVYDKSGKNLAPHGASIVKLDTKTEALSVER